MELHWHTHWCLCVKYSNCSNSMCTKVEKKEYVFLWVERSFFLDIIILWCPPWWCYSYQINLWSWVLCLHQDLLPLYWHCIQCQFIWTSKRTTAMALEASDQHLLYSRTHTTYQSSWIFRYCHEMPPVITPILKSILNLKTPPLYQSCELVCSKCRVSKVNPPTKAQQDWEGA